VSHSRDEGFREQAKSFSEYIFEKGIKTISAVDFVEQYKKLDLRDNALFEDNTSEKFLAGSHRLPLSLSPKKKDF